MKPFVYITFILTCTSCTMTDMRGCHNTPVYLVCVRVNDSESFKVEQPEKIKRIDITLSDLGAIKPEHLGQFNNAEWLSITHSILPANGIFSRMKRLKYAEISNATDFSISNIEDLVNSPSLLNITIKESDVMYLTNSTFSQAPVLESIDLVENRIRRIDPGAFSNLPRLKNVNLTNNDIEWHSYDNEQIDNWVDKLVELGAELQLGGNPICATERQAIPQHLVPILTSACGEEANFGQGEEEPSTQEQGLPCTTDEEKSKNESSNGSDVYTALVEKVLKHMALLTLLIWGCVLLYNIIKRLRPVPNGKNEGVDAVALIPDQGETTV